MSIYQPPGHSRLHARAPKRRKVSPAAWLILFVGMAAGVTALAGVIAATSLDLSPVGTPDLSATPSQAPVVAAPATAQPTLVLADQGSSTKITESFTVHGNWDFGYVFHCPDGMGTFQAWVSGSANDVLVNKLAVKGNDVAHQHDGPGRISIEVSSVCPWSIRVIQLP